MMTSLLLTAVVEALMQFMTTFAYVESARLNMLE